MNRYTSRRRVLSLVPGLAVAAAASPALAGAATGGSFVVRDVRIFDGHRVMERGSVMVTGGLITEVGGLSRSSRHQVVDGGGRTLLPGLIDCHVHSFEGSRADALRFGVTTELDMFNDPSALPAARRQRRSAAKVDQADLWSAGIGVTVPGGHPLRPDWDFPRVVADTDIERFVADRVAEGSDFIKVIFEDGGPPPRPSLPTLTTGQVRSVITAAHRHRRRAVVHAEKLQLALTAVRSGADGLVHVFWDTEGGPEDIAAIRRSAAFVVPTLSVVDWGTGAKELLADARITPWLSATQRHLLQQQPPDRPGRPDFLKIGSANVRELHAAGVPILAGTDTPIRANANGVSMMIELSHLVRAGLDPREALVAATAAPARAFGLADRGRIAPGLRADLLLVDGDPTTDITDLRAITAIWKNGHLVDRTPPEQERAPQLDGH
ncbi:amidohydrolase family protein [Actinomadura rudentiformis]|uniref:Amidohydrolase family protein n=1 Tax=Actinomadura rudentiformis TaxID=359158 RepID=A0A6H9Z3E4_9ACTN|nr:amidohydrolase family protein [Actinomadura rudentiformis]KAB2352602.1 amidohydrolase family protein [Actinomadura rudentiformis]